MTDLQTWTDTQIDAKMQQLMDDAYNEIEEHKKKISAINTEIAELQKEKMRRKGREQE